MEKPSALPRRDWLKMITLGGAAAMLPGAAQAQETHAKKVRGVIFMVSDGMSPGVLTMAEAFSQLTRKRGTAWHALFQDKGATCGLMDTASANSLVTDSAAASSAWGSGRRVNNGSINVSPEGNEQTPIFKILKEKGLLTGLVTTATVTHATPAGFAAIQKERNEEDDIAPQYLNRVDVILGGGTGHFDAATRKDKRDVSREFAAAGYGIVKDRAGLLAAREEKLLGLFYPGHLPYSIDRNRQKRLAEKVPTLAEMAEVALRRFLDSGKPFLLQVEGARIDHAAHMNDIGALLHEQLAFDDTVAKVFSMIGDRDDVLVVVTSDHGNSNPGVVGTGKSYERSTSDFAKIARHTASHEWMFEHWENTGAAPADLADLVLTHLRYGLKHRQAEALAAVIKKQAVVEWNDQLKKPEGLLGQFTGNHVGIGWTGTTHTSDPTLISAKGPGAERFAGWVRNHEVFGHFRDLLG